MTPFFRLREVIGASAELSLDGASADDMRALGAACRWVVHYLCRPHADLGRKGDVCPYTRPAIKEDLFYIAVLRTDVEDPRPVIREAVLETRRQFLLREPTSGPRALFKTMVFVLPDVPPERCADVVEAVQKELLQEFLDLGMMLGDFHPLSSAPGMHNDHFHPLRSPIPLLGMRHMVPTDIVFLTRTDDQLRAYLSRFGQEGHNAIEVLLATARARLDPAAIARLEGVEIRPLRPARR